MAETNLKRQFFSVQRADREKQNGHRGKVIWFTGLSCSGKSTLANLLDQALFEQGYHTYILDGDNIRMGLNTNLSFSREDRVENLRRVAEVAKLFCDAGIVVLASFITPLESDRENIKKIIGQDDLLSIFVDCPLEECEKRDVKGFYAKARAGEITNYTGIDAPFERPVSPDFTLNTSTQSPQDAKAQLFQWMKSKI